MSNQAIEKTVRQSIIQAPELRQLTGRGAKAIQVNVQILGNDAIDRACADDGDIFGAMRHILAALPEPRMLWLKCLAMVVGLEIFGTKVAASEYLGIDRVRFDRKKNSYASLIKAIQDGTITVGQRADRRTKSGMSTRDEIFQPDGRDL